MKTCQAPARIPDELYEQLDKKLETDEPEEVAADAMMLMAEYDRPCGDIAVGYVSHGGRRVAVCQYHLEQHRALMQPTLNLLDRTVN